MIYDMKVMSNYCVGHGTDMLDPLYHLGSGGAVETSFGLHLEQLPFDT